MFVAAARRGAASQARRAAGAARTLSGAGGGGSRREWFLRQREREREREAPREARAEAREPGPRAAARRGAPEPGHGWETRRGPHLVQPGRGGGGRAEPTSARQPERAPERGRDSAPRRASRPRFGAESDGGRARAWGSSPEARQGARPAPAPSPRPSALGEAPRAEEAPHGLEFVATPNAVAAALLSGSRSRVSALYLQNDRDDLFPEAARKELEDRARQRQARVHHISREGLVREQACAPRHWQAGDRWRAAWLTDRDAPLTR
jgi:hypothetical protein